jgi:hypothetical protein
MEIAAGFFFEVDAQDPAIEFAAFGPFAHNLAEACDEKNLDISELFHTSA